MTGYIKHYNAEKKIGFITNGMEDFFFSEYKVLNQKILSTVELKNKQNKVYFQIKDQIVHSKEKRIAVNVIVADESDEVDINLFNINQIGVTNTFVKEQYGNQHLFSVEDIETILQKYSAYKSNINNATYHLSLQNKKIELILSTYNIFVDTNIFMHENFNYVYAKKIKPVLEQHNKKLIILESSIAEVNNLIENKNLVTSAKAKKAAQTIKTLLEKREMSILQIHDSDNTFSDQDFIGLFIQYRTKYDTCLLTNDKNLQKDILENINSLSSVRANHDIAILQIKNEKLSLVENQEQYRIEIDQSFYINL